MPGIKRADSQKACVLYEHRLSDTRGEASGFWTTVSGDAALDGADLYVAPIFKNEFRPFWSEWARDMSACLQKAADSRRKGVRMQFER